MGSPRRPISAGTFLFLRRHSQESFFECWLLFYWRQIRNPWLGLPAPSYSWNWPTLTCSTIYTSVALRVVWGLSKYCISMPPYLDDLWDFDMLLSYRVQTVDWGPTPSVIVIQMILAWEVSILFLFSIRVCPSSVWSWILPNCTDYPTGVSGIYGILYGDNRL